MTDNELRHIFRSSPHTEPGLIRRAARLMAAGIGLLMMWSCGAENSVKKGDAFYAIGEYFDAAAEYKKAYQRTPVKEKEKRGQRAWKMAESYRKIHFAAKAMGGYQNAVRYRYADSLLYLRLAQMQHRMGNYKDAVRNYTIHLDSMPGDRRALNGRTGCLQAVQWKARPTLYTVKKEQILNGRRVDYSPALYGDEWDQIYFTTTRPQVKGNEISGITGMKSADIWMSKKDDKGKWSSPEALESDVNSDYDEGACSFTPDGKTMYFTRCTYDADYPRFAEIFSSQRTDASWSAPQRVEISRDTLSSYAHPAVSPDGKWLYFTSDMPGGMGGTDIWRIALSEHGLGGVENLGAPINTEGDEMFPSFRGNGEFYFSSDGHPGMGGLDLFRAIPDTANGGFLRAENLRVPMNSNGDDFGMTFEGLHNRGYFSTSRGDARGWDHLMWFECPEVLQTVKGWVYEKDGYELPQAEVYMVGNDGTNKRLSVRSDGSFVEQVNPLVSYVFLGTCKGYLNHKQELTVDTSSVSREYVLQFPLPSIHIPVLIRNVRYAFDSAELSDSSTVELDSLVALLQENPNITIELASHCDFRGRDEYNLALSQRRAESVVRYLIAHGVDRERLTPVGYGEERPKVVTRRIAQENPFLHEGDTLTEAFITRMENKEEQEACHAINRRTEFRVLRTTFRLFDLPEKMKEEQEQQATAQKDAEAGKPRREQEPLPPEPDAPGSGR